jgi:hypothetical protein
MRRLGPCEILIEVPEDVIRDLVFDPRNEAEREYRPPEQRAARHAWGIANLFVRATEAEYELSSVIALNWNVSTMRLPNPTGGDVDTEVFGETPMLFIDVFDEPHAAKIVDPLGGEILFAQLHSFTKEQAIALAHILRAGYNSGNYSVHGLGGTSWVKKLKDQGGF